MKLRTKNVIVTAAAILIVLLLIHGPATAQAYWGDDYGPSWSGHYGLGNCEGCGGLCCGGVGGYYAGQQDAIYDHDNGYNYNPFQRTNIAISSKIRYSN